jgi:transposase
MSDEIKAWARNRTIELYKDGLEPKYIAERVGLSKRLIYTWIQEYKNNERI